MAQALTRIRRWRDRLKVRLAERAAVTSPAVIVGAIFMNLAIALSLFVVAALLGSVLLAVAAAWLLVPMAMNVYMLLLDVDRPGG